VPPFLLTGGRTLHPALVDDTTTRAPVGRKVIVGGRHRLTVPGLGLIEVGRSPPQTDPNKKARPIIGRACFPVCVTAAVSTCPQAAP